MRSCGPGRRDTGRAGPGRGARRRGGAGVRGRGRGAPGPPRGVPRGARAVGDGDRRGQGPLGSRPPQVAEGDVPAAAPLAPSGPADGTETTDPGPRLPVAVGEPAARDGPRRPARAARPEPVRDLLGTEADRDGRAGRGGRDRVVPRAPAEPEPPFAGTYTPEVAFAFARGARPTPDLAPETPEAPEAVPTRENAPERPPARPRRVRQMRRAAPETQEPPAPVEPAPYVDSPRMAAFKALPFWEQVARVWPKAGPGCAMCGGSGILDTRRHSYTCPSCAGPVVRLDGVPA